MQAYLILCMLWSGADIYSHRFLAVNIHNTSSQVLTDNKTGMANSHYFFYKWKPNTDADAITDEKVRVFIQQFVSICVFQ